MANRSKIRVQCSNCGIIWEVPKEKARDIVRAGWDSYGSAFYCPECVATWETRNKDKELAGPIETLIKVYEKGMKV